MATLTRELRRSLENTVREARRIAEAGARKVIEQLAVHHHEPWPSMTPEQRVLRSALRAHGRQLGDRRDERRGIQAIDRLTTECAYEHWHRMLFARFLAETNLLIEPESGMDITLEDCRELARERGEDWLELASSFAERMLPEIFRTGDPVLKVALPPETRSDLENLLKALPRDVFIADDSLGWVYQYWQADRKEEIDHSEKKIGADELPSVTQLFTEDYMVLFLLHNTLGAWWAGKVLEASTGLAISASTEDELRAACAVGTIEWTYLRFVRDGDGPWRPAAGTFEGWPKAAKDITVLDPCMGSGHFLVFALPILVAFRMAEERLSQDDAVDAVLRDNLFGLEIDPRCTQIAAFNLAFSAWRTVGYRHLPRIHLACSGLALGATKIEWLKLAERAAASSTIPPTRDLLGTQDNLFSDAMRRGFEHLYELFVRAPSLGSLIDPRGAGGDLIEYGFADLEPLLGQVLVQADHASDSELSEMAVAAQGMSKAAEILAGQFTLVTTNVPYLGSGKQDEVLKDYCERRHPEAKADLATCFVERCLGFCGRGGSSALVTPQNWFFLGTYKALRGNLFNKRVWNLVAKLGPAAFEDMNWWAANTAIFVLSNFTPDSAHTIHGLDVSASKDPKVKAELLIKSSISSVLQAGQLKNPDARLLLIPLPDLPLLQEFAECFQGISPADFARFGRFIWEVVELSGFRFWQSTIDETLPYGGRDLLLWWSEGLEEAVEAGSAFLRGHKAWGKAGVVVRQMRHLPCTLYTGEVFDTNCAVIVPEDPKVLPAIWAFCSSPDFANTVRQIDQKTNVTNATLVKVPFELAHWRRVGEEKFPLGLPRPHSDDPTQWLFDGQPKGAAFPLQVAAARLLGYRWPRQNGSTFHDCAALGLDNLEAHAAKSGIVCLTPLRGDPPASERLIGLLAAAYGSEWSAAKLAGLLAEAGFADKSLDEWLRDDYFFQHCELFHQRPFILHLWDGRRDGFHALINYHKLAGPKGEGKRLLETLIYTYLGDWIDRQRADRAAGVEGADGRLAASEHLRAELEKILSGEPPYDLFVRWRPLADQPIGWEPDINDGVRINLRPFMAAKPLGARTKGACILRTTPKTKWEKDRGKEPQRPREDFPWFWGWDERTENFEGTKTFDGNRWNDLHYSRSFKEAARARSKK